MHQEEGRPEHRQGDVRAALPPARAVEHRGLVDLDRQVLQGREEHQHEGAGGGPDASMMTTHIATDGPESHSHS